jgi:hypothetical protein
VIEIEAGRLEVGRDGTIESVEGGEARTPLVAVRAFGLLQHLTVKETCNGRVVESEVLKPFETTVILLRLVVPGIGG